MKKVNLFNKKVMSVGLATSVFATSLGSTACFAEKVDVGTQTEYRNMEAQTDDSIFESQKPIVAAGTEEIAETNEIKAEAVKNEENEIKKESEVKAEEKEIKEEPKAEKKSKKEIAKTVAKVVAAAAIAGTVAYFGYKYRAPIAENLTAAGKYIVDSAKSAATSVATGTKNLAGRAVNATKSAGSYIAGKATSAVNSIKSFGSKNKDSQENIDQILTYNSNTTAGNITNSTETTDGYCHNPWFKNDFKANTPNVAPIEISTAFSEVQPSVNTSAPETNIANTTSSIERPMFETNVKASTPKAARFELLTDNDGYDFSNRSPLLIDNSEVLKSEPTEPGKISKIAGKASDFWINTKKELKVKSEEPCVKKELMKIIKGSYANYVKPLNISGKFKDFIKFQKECAAKSRKHREVLEHARREQEQMDIVKKRIKELRKAGKFREF